MRVAGDITELIGNTPVVRLKKLVGEDKAKVLVKLEFFNPGASIKDRTALGMIRQAEEDGILRPGSVIVEPTSGNTGIGLAMIAAVKGYRMIVVMPDSMSIERRKLMAAYGAEVVLTPGAQGMAGAIEKARELVSAYKNSFMPQQFENPANSAIHARTTAREIIAQTGGKLDVFVSAVGTGGTLTGIGAVLKEEIPGIKVVAVEPAGSPVLSGGQKGAHKIQGIGAGFIPKVLDTKIIDQVFQVTDEQSLETARKLAREEGVFAGISSGAAVYAAVQMAQERSPEQVILTITPDTGERYLSSELLD